MNVILKSHNDENATVPVYGAYAQGCRLFEADVIYSGGQIMCAHSWRPKILCAMSLSYYLVRLSMVAAARFTRPFYLQIDIKTFLPCAVNPIIKELCKLLEYSPNIIVGIYASDKWYTPGRVRVKNEVLEYFKSSDFARRVMEYSEMEVLIISDGSTIITKDF